jgi:FkbM family methyltransferase
MKIISGIIKLLQGIEQQRFNVFDVMRGGYSISSHRILMGIGAHCREIKTIIDVGANQGQFALASTKKFPNANVISFEPLPEQYENFKVNLRNSKKVKIYNLALGEKVGIIDFYRNDHSHASSALPISEEQKKAIPETARTTKIQVGINRLDEVIQVNEIKGPSLLKLDVQGYERNVLEGATKLLPTIDYLVFEASFIPMYQGEPLFNEMHLYLKNIGFEIVAPVGFLEGKNGGILQIDFLYKNNRNSTNYL